MRIDKPIAFLDIEGTGTDPSTDRIVELAIVLLKPDGRRKDFVQRFNPGIPIPAAATEIHGITDADVAQCPKFELFAARILEGLKGKDLAGYNLRLYDLPILDEELRRCGLKLELEGVRVIDCFGIFAKKEPRKLEDAVRRYCGREHEGAHGALADTQATVDVFLGQMAAYPDLDQMSLEEVAEFSRRSEQKEADLAGKLYIDKDGDVCFAFGKWRDGKVRDHWDYCQWMLDRGNFPGSTKEWLQKEIERLNQEHGR